MNKIIIAGALLILIIAGDTRAQTLGPGASILFGGNICIESGDFKCDNVDGSFAFGAAGLYRFLPKLGAFLDLTYGMFSPEIGDMSVLAITVGPRGYYPLGPVELNAGLGLGYSRLMAENGSLEAYANGVALTLQGGVDYWANQQVFLGVLIRYAMNFVGDYCIESGGTTVCNDDDGNTPNNLILGAQAGMRF